MKQQFVDDKTLRALISSALVFFACVHSALAYDATINSVAFTGSDDIIIDADADNPGALYQRDRVPFSVQTTFTRTAGESATTNYRYALRLLDPEGNPVLLATPAGGTADVLSPTITVNFGTATSVTITTNADFAPAEQLSASKEYRLEIQVGRMVSGSLTVMDTRESASRRFWHFTGTNASPTAPRRNVVARVSKIAWEKDHALTTGNTAAQRRFVARVQIQVKRYYNWEAADPGTDNVQFRVTTRLKSNDATPAQIALDAEAPGIFDNVLAIPHFVVNSFGVPEPWSDTINIDIGLRPGAQIDTINKLFFAEADLEHIEASTYVTDETAATSPIRALMHFNGSLIAAGTGGAALVMTELGNEPVDHGLDVPNGNRQVGLAVIRGHLAANPAYNLRAVLAPGYAAQARLFNDGRAEITTANLPIQVPPMEITSPAPGNMEFTRSNMVLTSTGMMSDISLRLPRGMGVVEVGSQNSRLARDFLLKPAHPIHPTLLVPAGSIVFPAPNPVTHFGLTEETKPFLIRCNWITWNITDGIITPGPTPSGWDRVTYVRKLETEALALIPLPEEEKTVRSNTAHYASLAGTETSSAFRAANDGTARFAGIIDFAAGNARTHFPYDAQLAWNAGGSFTFINNQPTADSAGLPGVGAGVTYRRDCGGSSCDTIGDVQIGVAAGGNPFRMTLDGGLALSGQLPAEPDLQIGFIGALTTDPANPVFAHRMRSFLNASFLTAGHVLFSQNYTGDADHGPGTLLNSGFSPTDPTLAQRPLDAAYAAGSADYPGVNLRVTGQPRSVTGRSVLGGTASPNYTLANRSKYYVRLAGVSGIHQPTANPFTGPVLLCGYPFEFDSFALSFLGSRVRDSRTRGSISIPDPADPALGFEVAFNPILFSCNGAPTTLEIDGGPFDHTLAYWQADIRGLSAAFVPKIGNTCDPSEAFFTLGVQGHLSNFDAPLFGTLAFDPFGDLISPSDPQCPPGLDSRLRPAASIGFAGPGGERYAFTPLHGVYPNRFAEALPAFRGVGQGFMNAPGLLDVAFFRDLEVHIQTGGRANNTTDPIHIMAGWNEGGDTFFNKAQFDLTNSGHPGGGVALADYRAATDPAWRPAARQQWLGLVNFDYPLQWDTAARSFKSPESLEAEFLVIHANHEVRYLSAETAEIDFGAGIDLDIPEINLAAIQPGTAIHNVFDGAIRSVTSAIVQGIDGADDLLDDLADRMFDQVFTAVADPITDALATAIANQADAIVSPADLDAIVDPALDSLAAAFENANDLAAVLNDEVDGRLAAMQSAIRGIIGVIEVNADGEIIPGNLVLTLPEDFDLGAEITRPGLFFRSGSEGNLDYEIASFIIRTLLEEIDPESIANILLAQGAEALDQALRNALEKNSAQIEQIKRNLMQVHNAIGEIRAQAQLAGALAAEFANATTEITSIIEGVRQALDVRLQLGNITEYGRAEIEAILRREVRDRFSASALLGRYQQLARSYVYQLDAAMRSGIESAVAGLNDIIAKILADHLPLIGPLEEMLGDLAGCAVSGNIDGYARIIGDSLRTLRLDADFEWKMPDAFSFRGFIEINNLQSSGSPSCGVNASTATAAEVRLGAENVGVSWLGSDLRFDVGTKLSFTSSGIPAGMAGAIELTEGRVKFEAMEIVELGAAAAFGLTENYMAAKAGVLFNGDPMFGGVFFGRTCTLDPLLLVDPDVAAVLPPPNPTFTGIYTYGEAFIPIVNVGCLFKLSASAGVGIFAFAEDATVGGKMKVGADARAICAVNIGGDLTLLGTKAGNDFRFLGAGRLYGSAGVKPLEVSFDKKVTLTFQDGRWDYDY